MRIYVEFILSIVVAAGIVLAAWHLINKGVKDCESKKRAYFYGKCL
jgi:hypothetical protein